VKRRTFIAALGVGAFWPPAGRAQQPKTATIGILVPGNLDPTPFVSIFKEELRRLGYLEGQNLQFEFRTAEGKMDALPALAAELVRARVDIIVTWLTPAVRAAKQATSQIPVVMAGAGDPVATGVVASLARPGGNITGMAGVTAELAGKNVELIREMLPSAKRLAVLCNALDSFTRPFLAQIEGVAPGAGFELNPIMVSGNDEFEMSFARLSKDGADAVIVQPSLPTKRAAELALLAHLPIASPIESFAREGGLICYAGRSSDQYRLAAVYVDKILKGSKPADLPVQLPTQFDLRINLKTAKALGLVVPPAMLARADEVIE
jgi:putative ABC transport system substrate-binding protein